VGVFGGDLGCWGSPVGVFGGDLGCWGSPVGLFGGDLGCLGGPVGLFGGDGGCWGTPVVELFFKFAYWAQILPMGSCERARAREAYGASPAGASASTSATPVSSLSGAPGDDSSAGGGYLGLRLPGGGDVLP